MSPPQSRSPLLAALVCAIVSLSARAGSSPASTNAPNPSEFKTPETAQTIRLDALARLVPGRLGFLGLNTETDAYQRLVAVAVAPGSPASRAGVQTNDIIVRIDGQEAATPDAFRKLIQSRSPGESLELSLRRAGEPVEVTAKLAALGSAGRPLERVRLGVRLGDIRTSGGAIVEEVDADSRGARAGLKPGDLLLKINGTVLDTSEKIAGLMADLPATETVKLTVFRASNDLELAAQLAPSDSPDRPAPAGRRGYTVRGGGGGRGFNNRAIRDNLRLAIVGIEFPDVKHNPVIGTNDWQQELFSTNTYTNRSVTGQAAHGSLNDYYSEQSDGLMRVTGRMFDWVEVSKNRLDYAAVTNTAAAGGRGAAGGSGFDQDGPLLNEVLDKLVAREGRDALLGYDGVVFLYAGGRATRIDTNVFWPHSTGLNFQNRRLRYLISCEGGDRMADISVLCHETGHVLGLPDLYVRRQPDTPPNPRATNTVGITITGTSQSTNRNPNPYVESLAYWDLMAVQTPNGRPQHLSAWSKEQLGWLKPAVIDPTVRQQLVLAPVEKTTNQCFKIPLRPDGSEYLLLENRNRRVGFDASLPADGLLIWHVVYGRPVLEEANGATGPNAASRDTRNVPFPSSRNNAFTPFTKPSSAAYTGDELPVYITDIRRLPDGKITFTIGDGFD